MSKLLNIPAGKSRTIDLVSLATVSNPAYVKKCAKIVNEALKNGLNVLHHDNGDIEISITVYITSHYVWDARSAKLVLFKRSESKSSSILDVPEPIGGDANRFESEDYVNSCSQIITRALQSGHDVMNLENGELLVIEHKSEVKHYSWDVKLQDMLLK
jgi:Protein of unknown function (DUF2671)